MKSNHLVTADLLRGGERGESEALYVCYCGGGIGYAKCCCTVCLVYMENWKHWFVLLGYLEILLLCFFSLWHRHTEFHIHLKCKRLLKCRKEPSEAWKITESSFIYFFFFSSSFCLFCLNVQTLQTISKNERIYKLGLEVCSHVCQTEFHIHPLVELFHGFGELVIDSLRLLLLFAAQVSHAFSFCISVEISSTLSASHFCWIWLHCVTAICRGRSG